jgi:hypothetical protein
VASELLIFVSHLSVAFFRVILRIVLVTQFSPVLRDGSLLWCHIISSLCLSFRKWSGASRSLLNLCEFACWQPVCWGSRGYEITCCFLSLFNIVNVDSRRNYFRG